MSVESLHRRVGGAIFAVGAIQLVVSMILVQLDYPGYNDSRNPVSDLGNSTLSRLALLYNGSIIIAGIAGILTTIMVTRLFQKRRSGLVAFGIFTVANVGLIGVGIFPEDTTALGGSAHSIAGQLAFVGYALALIAFAVAMRHNPGWKNYDLFTLVMGVVSIVAVLLYGENLYLGLGPGGMERIFLAANIAWMFAIGLHLFGRSMTVPSGRSSV